VVDDAIGSGELSAEFTFGRGHGFDIVTAETRSLQE
jgi:hypothetical protein